MKNKKVLFLYWLLAIVAALAIDVRAQQPTPTPAESTATSREETSEGTPVGNYNIISSIELGVRGLGIDGSRNKYYSDLNYRAGFRIFDSSFLARARTEKGTLFDTLLITSSGFGSDPLGTLRISAEKSKLWNLDVSYRHNAYDNIIACCNFAQARAVGPNLGVGVSQNFTRAEHNFADVDLKVFPTNRNFRLNFGFTIDRFGGPGGSSLSYARDDYALQKEWDTKSNEVRGGFEARIGGLDLAFTQGYRSYRDESTFFSGPNQGNTLGNFSLLTSFQRIQPTNSRAWYSRFSVHTQIAKRFDITARYIYTKSTSSFNFVETAIGQGTLEGQNVFILLNQVEAAGDNIERSTHLVDVGFTWRITDKLRISNTFRYNKFTVDGSFSYSDIRQLRRQNLTIVTPFPIVLTLNPFRELDLSRVQNNLEFSYDFGPRFGIFLGHRYIHRNLRERALQRVYPLDSATLAAARAFASDVEAENSTNGVFGGFKARPFPFWNIYFDFNRGNSDHVFTRVDAYDVLNFRLRNRFALKKGLNLTLSLVTKDNNNPGVVDEAFLGVPEFDVDISSRIFTSLLDWAPPGRSYFIGGGYTYQHITSDVAILFPRGGAFVPGQSQYFMRDHYFFFNAGFRPHPRLSFYARYSINNDTGQGDRASNDATGIFIRSLPMRFQTPEARMVFRINNRLDWTVGYQYYNYREDIRGLFPDTFVNQDYRAHLPYTSLRIYFGRKER